jgi:hypothetical protein
MQIKNTAEYTFTKEEVEAILISKVAFLTGNRENENATGTVAWDIQKGDTGIKDPMDYSDYAPTKVKTVTVTI